MAKCKNCRNLLAKEEISIGHLHSYKWCPIINDNPDDERERDCDDFECMTNADRIRSMSDEELAEALIFYDSYYDGYSHVFEPYITHPVKEEVEKMCLKWLKSEVEEK